jgi:DNA-directed RNA polymerase specialized sigma24 family protein
MPDRSARKFGSFDETHWSLVGRVQHGDAPTRRAALDDLLRTYYPPLRAHLVLGKRIEPHLAEDLLQGFVADRILEKDLIAGADHEKGKFRSLLLRSLDNYAIDWFRRETARRRAEEGKGRQSANQSHEMAGQDSPTADPFTAEWARRVLSQSLEQMHSECQQQERSQVWGVFVGRVLRPLVTAASPTPYEELVREYALSTPEQASNTLMTAKRQFQRTIHDVVGQYCCSDEEIEADIVDLRRSLLSVNLSDLGGMTDHPEAAPARTSGGFPDIDDTTSDLLAELLDIQTDRDSLWTETDMTAILRHQMVIPLHRAFASCSVDASLAMKDPPSLSDFTFDDLLHRDKPPLDVLNAVKRLARNNIRQELSAVPTEIATVFYYASIALALVRCDEHISRSDDEVLQTGFQMILCRPWIEDELRTLLQSAVEHMQQRSL